MDSTHLKAVETECVLTGKHSCILFEPFETHRALENGLEELQVHLNCALSLHSTQLFDVIFSMKRT